MDELELDVCEAGEAVYLTLARPGGTAPASGEGPAWLVIDGGLHIQVSRHANPRGGTLRLRLSRADLPHLPTEAVLITATARRRLVPRLRRLGPAERVKGHVAGVASGALFGWALDETRPEQEVPVEVTFPDRTLLGMTEGRWHDDVPRAFSIPLPDDLPRNCPVPVTVRAMPGGAAFARAPLNLIATPAGWMLAAPPRRRGATLEGEVLLASAPTKPVSLTLRTADGRAFHAECSLPGESRFGARPCSFRIDGLPDRLEGARLTIAHDAIGADEPEFDLAALGPQPAAGAGG